MTPQPDCHGPRLLIQATTCRGEAIRGQWVIAWRLQNLGPEPLHILSTWLPHDKFSGRQVDLDPPLRLSPGESGHLERLVACDEPPGSVVENAFLILRCLWQQQPWRTFARLRVLWDGTGVPQPACEAVTVQPIGFSTQSRRGGSGSDPH